MVRVDSWSGGRQRAIDRDRRTNPAGHGRLGLHEHNPETTVAWHTGLGVRERWHLIIGVPEAAIILLVLRAVPRRKSPSEKNGPLNYIPIGSHAE